MKKFSLFLAAMLSVAAIAGMGGVETVNMTATAATNSYTNYTSVSSLDSGLVIEPTLVFEPTSFSEITDAGKVKKKPASVIVTPDADMNVELGTESRKLANVFDTYLKNKFIPIVRLSAETVEPFLDWLNHTYAISDMMAVSDDITVLETLYADEAGYLVNTVYDLTSVKLTAGRYDEWPHVAAANKAGCNILMYDGADENLPVAAEYVEAMTKLCWAYTESTEEAVYAMAAGCYGVVSASYTEMGEAIGYFSESGFARAQYIAAHRGITKYANEQSLTGIMASYNEGATHVEIDIQITKDEEIFINHNSDVGYVTGKSGVYFVNATAEQIRRIKFGGTNAYSQKYGDTFASLREVCDNMRYTDVILIIELKLDNGSDKAVNELHAIENLKKVMDEYPEMAGHWFCITFYAPYAQKMKEVLPEIPVGFLGAATSSLESANSQPGWGGWVTRGNMPNCLKNVLRKYNVTLDEMTYDNGDTIADDRRVDGTTNRMAQDWLARGYAQNTWTFENLLHYTIKCNIATTNKAEDCAMIVKEIGAPASISAADLAAGKVTVPCTTYNGWVVEKECKIIVVSEGDGTAKVLLYLEQNSGDKANVTFGLYSNLLEVAIA